MENYTLSSSKILVIILFIGIIINNLWYVIFIYRDTKKRKIDNKPLWYLLALFLGSWMIPIYNSQTTKPQTLLTASPADIIWEDKSAKTRKRSKIFLIIFFVICLLAYILQIMTNGKSFQETITTDEHVLINLLLLVMMICYFIFAPTKNGKLNPLDKPLWGMKQTTAGNIDESLTKHKKIVKFLIWFIVFIFIFLIGLFIYTCSTVPSK